MARRPSGKPPAQVCGMPCLDRGLQAPVQTGPTVGLCRRPLDPCWEGLTGPLWACQVRAARA
eukprot:NODE_3093_length_981_cov_50.800429_g2578_i0.p6 GENE.NODE_3093_length_981_cov_50.800429_g2578_i0~~NODE_3093_length_981_cov_50.800429_g2578_i0.p6  ORF type:complete len:62 (+),score=0.05 NODE_3093_length_981_cov_50.800429_g2578_i0:408-593(+)